MRAARPATRERRTEEEGKCPKIFHVPQCLLITLIATYIPNRLAIDCQIPKII